jgi:nicotinate-nucleotide pyrophosphorylase (carboxylating)
MIGLIPSCRGSLPDELVLCKPTQNLHAAMRLNDLSLPDLYAALDATGLVRRLVELARDEDLGPERLDATSRAVVPADDWTEGAVVARDGGVVAGLSVGTEVARAFSEALAFEPLVADGTPVDRGTRLAMLSGPGAQVLAAERTLLNVLGRLSGVATRTAEFVAIMGPGRRARLYDTRKTTPGLRVLEKYAVRCGGGHCHRLGLYDAVLIKDNHLAGVALDQLAPFVAAAAARARVHLPAPAFVEVEVDSVDQLRALLALPQGTIDIILLDNMTLDQVRDAVCLRDAAGPGPELEVSGGVTLKTIRDLAATGVERISTGSVTHHAVWLDIALDVEPGGRHG